LKDRRNFIFELKIGKNKRKYFDLLLIMRSNSSIYVGDCYYLSCFFKCETQKFFLFWVFFVIFKESVQVNFSGPEKYFPNFGNFGNFSSGNKSLTRGWNKVAPRLSKVKGAPAGLWQGDIDFLGKDRLGKVLFSHNYKYCQRAQTFSQGPLKLTCAKESIRLGFYMKHSVLNPLQFNEFWSDYLSYWTLVDRSQGNFFEKNPMK